MSNSVMLSDLIRHWPRDWFPEQIRQAENRCAWYADPNRGGNPEALAQETAYLHLLNYEYASRQWDEF